MAKILQKELDQIKKYFFSIGTLVEESVQKSLKALETRDPHLAKEIIDNDHKIDDMEVHLEENCLKTLALHQPVAFDLRFIISILKINNDLERIGDLAVNICKRVIPLAQDNLNFYPIHIREMFQKTQEMLRKSLNALAEYDAKLAYEICADDDEIDQINRKIYALVKEEIANHPKQFETFLNFLSVSRFLERIADYATNIAEDVIYLVEGEIIRHKHKEQ